MLMRQSVRRISRGHRLLLKESLTRDQFRLYQLIWKRFAASRMADAQYTIRLPLKSMQQDIVLHVSASKLTFDGFMAVYVQDEEEKDEAKSFLKETAIRDQS